MSRYYDLYRHLKRKEAAIAALLDLAEPMIDLRDLSADDRSLWLELLESTP